MPSGLPLVHLHPTSAVELGGTSMVLASVRDRLSLTREGKLWWRVSVHLHLGIYQEFFFSLFYVSQLSRV